jgi:hypothetical protein
MANEIPPASRLLFVIDNDFGALGTVMYLLHRQPLAARATVLLPRRAHELHQGGLPVATRPYESLQDILAVVEAEAPDVACLVSGYLLSRHNLLSYDELQRLIRTLRARGCRVATSDPYLGTFSEVAKASVLVRTGAFHRNLERYLRRVPRIRERVARLVELYSKRRLERHVRRVSEVLRDVTRIYPVPIDAPQGVARSISFFNPLYIRAPGELAANAANVAALPGMNAAKPRWLFVLAQFDLDYQEKKHGMKGFVAIVARKIREAAANGRHTTFIGPAAIIAELAPLFAGEPDVTLLATCAFDEFERRLLDAEVAFYWQIFSTSAFLRLWQGLPVFFFDPGHSSRFSKPMHEAGLKYYFMGGAPIYLDIDKPLDAAALAPMGAVFHESAAESRRRLARLPTPAAMVGSILKPV